MNDNNYFDTLNEKIESEELVVCIVGMGYIGKSLLHSILNFTKKVNVNVYDINKRKVLKDLSQIYGQEIFNRTVISDSPNIIKNSDVIVICVPTPLYENSQNPNLEYIEKAVIDINDNCKLGSLIIVESTVYPGFTENYFGKKLAESGKKIGHNLFLCYSSERINPGGKEDIREIPKVVGGYSPYCLNVGSRFYEKFTIDTVKCKSIIEAELSKLLENTYRFINISFINEFAEQCYSLGANPWNVIKIASTKPFGFQKFLPGPGIGGHCIPVDPFYLKYSLKDTDIDSKFIDTAHLINNNNLYKIVERIRNNYFDKYREEITNILIVGVTYKENVADIRESTAIGLIKILNNYNYNIDYYDPFIKKMDIDKKVYISKFPNKEFYNYYDVIIIHTPHSNLNYKDILESTAEIIDLRNKMDVT